MTTTFSEFQEHIAKHRLPTADQAYVTLGLVGEVGELFGYFAKSIRDEFTPDVKHIEKELGDILWFVGALANDVGTSLDRIANINIEKITSRAVAGTLQGSGDER
jgi:NTP pyrophosphatase (non-canonical NTP hydrolase)